MYKSDTIDFHSYLPPYRSLLNPDARYDYRTHSLIPISPNELSNINSGLKKYSFTARNATKSSLSMKYKSLLSDVSRSLSKRISNPNLISSQSPNSRSYPKNPILSKEFSSLPFEIIDYIFSLVDNTDDYRNCLLTSRLFYQFAKPYYYECLCFTSTYRFAQFITYLRSNSEVGLYVKSVDLSNIKPGNFDVSEEDELSDDNRVSFEYDTDTNFKILAGWRDWKFKTNPLYTIHPHPSSMCLTKTASNSQVSAHSKKSSSSNKSSNKFSKTLKYFKHRRRSCSTPPQPKKNPVVRSLNLGEPKTSHPKINRYLLNYASSRDLPIGYLIHLINLCPNMVSLNLANLSLSIDYEIMPSAIYKYQTFDLMNNYPKDLATTIDGLTQGAPRRSNFEISRLQQPTSSSSSVYSMATFSKPIRKYNSLLPPLPQTVSEISYLNKGDGKVFLSDLNLKSLNNAYLIKLDEHKILHTINEGYSKKLRGGLSKLSYINLSSMIWLNKGLIQSFLNKLLRADFDAFFETEIDVMDLQSIDDEDERLDSYYQDLIIDLTDSGMYKNLPWAKLIDMNSSEGCILVAKILSNQLLDEFEEVMRRAAMRRGRIAENYFS